MFCDRQTLKSIDRVSPNIKKKSINDANKKRSHVSDSH